MKAIKIRDREHWHEVRRLHVGGSDIGSLFNTFRLKESGEIVYRHLFQDQPKDSEFLGSVDRAFMFAIITYYFGERSIRKALNK